MSLVDKSSSIACSLSMLWQYHQLNTITEIMNGMQATLMVISFYLLVEDTTELCLLLWKVTNYYFFLPFWKAVFERL